MSSTSRHTRPTTPVTAAQLITKHNLQPHPEGGYYTRIYTAPHTITPHPATPLPPQYTQRPRPFATAIYFLLTTSQPLSHLHRIAGDELWFHVGGRPIAVVELDDSGESGRVVLGRVEDGYEAYHCVSGGRWFGAELVVSESEGEGGGGERQRGKQEDEEWVLVCCVVSGSFFFEEFELGNRATLLEQFPESAELVRRFTPDT